MKIYTQCLLMVLSLTDIVFGMNTKPTDEQLLRILDVTAQRNPECSEKNKKLKAMLQEKIKVLDVKSFAEIKGYGYKTANLQQLREIEKYFAKKSHEKQPVSVKVPEFIAISSKNVKDFLSDRGINLATRWEDVCREVDQESVRENNAFPEDFVKKLKALEKDIKAAFTESISNLKTAFHVEVEDESEYPNPDAWLDKNNNKKLMIRSTGREDTEEVANAGGNESVKNVAPATAAVLEAMGIVVSSYFSKKSFSQRLDIGDQKLFDEPIIPVLLQIMIGEKENAQPAEIPSAGVMFTEEAEGGFAQKRADSHSHETTGITFIQALFGHNEGLVNGLVPADSYYIDSQFYLHATICHKIARIKPANNIPVKNPQELINKQALPLLVLSKLKHIAIQLEKLYKKPMDVEFVYDPTEKTLYLVQARPITHKATTKPSYLKNLDALRSTKDTVTVRTIGTAGGSLLYITAYNQFLFSSTLRSACSNFFALPAKSTDYTQDREKIKCIIVEEMAPATSHEATTLRGAGKPVLYCHDQNKFYDICGLYPVNFVIDIQQETVIDWSNKTETDLEQLLKNTNEVAQGWYTYPIPCQSSLIEMQQVPKFATIDKAIEDLKNAAGEPLQELKDFVEKIGQQNPGWQTEMHALVDALKTFQASSANAILAMLLTRIKEAILSAERNKVPDELKGQLKGVARFVLSCIPELRAALKNEPGDMRRLYAIRFLEAILFQEADDNIISGYSYKQIIDTINQEKNIEKKGIVGEYQIQYTKIEPLAITDEIATKWRTCVSKLGDNSAPAAQNLAHLIRALAYFKLLSVWLNTSFAQMPENEFMSKIDQDVRQIFIIENGKYRPTPFFAKLQELQNQYVSFNPEMFSKSQDFGKKLKFLDDFVSYFKTNDFITAYRAATPLGKQAAISLLSSVLNAFDDSVHNVGGDHSYKITETTTDNTNLRTILLSYLDFLEWVMKLIPDALREPREAEIAKDIHVLRENLNQDVRKDEKEDRQRDDFYRDFAVVGFSTRGHLKPERYDEIFTTIHSSWENAIKICMYDLALKDLKLPNWVKKIKNKITELAQITTLGGELDGHEVYLYFNLPFPSHGVHIAMVYDLKKKSAGVSCNIVGLAATEPLPAGSTELPKLTEIWKEIGDCINCLYVSNKKAVSSDSKTDSSVRETDSSDSKTNSSGDNSKYSQYASTFWFDIKEDTPSDVIDSIGQDIIMLAKYANEDKDAYWLLKQRMDRLSDSSPLNNSKEKWKNRLNIEDD